MSVPEENLDPGVECSTAPLIQLLMDSYSGLRNRQMTTRQELMQFALLVKVLLDTSAQRKQHGERGQMFIDVPKDHTSMDGNRTWRCLQETIQGLIM